jgi:hypothetical protein
LKKIAAVKVFTGDAVSGWHIWGVWCCGWFIGISRVCAEARKEKLL